MNKEQTIEAIKVMQAYVDGKEIECDGRSYGKDWFLFDEHEEPAWNFPECKYRIKKNSHSINWDEVSDEYNYLSLDVSRGFLMLSEKKPLYSDRYKTYYYCESGYLSYAYMFKSAKKGDDPLEVVIRPNYKEKQ